MTNFYNLLFRPFKKEMLKRRSISNLSLVEVENAIKKFLEHSLSIEREVIENDHKLVTKMIIILFSHKKTMTGEDRFIREAFIPIDEWNLLRYVKFNYSQKMSDKFFKCPYMSFFFADFGLSK